MDFGQAYILGINTAYWLGIELLKRQDNFLFSLDDVARIVPPTSKHYAGIQDIPVVKILGTVDRSTDFSIGFYPLRQTMQERWTEVKTRLLANEIPQAIQVIEFGGYYFVSDGNHRVSVAKTNGIDFLTAEVTRYASPIKLYPAMTRQKLPLLQAKYAFYDATKVFDVLPEEHFQVACPSTWEMLKYLIFECHMDWFVKKNQRVPENEELITSWNEEIYAKTMNYIRLHSLSWLSPGKSDSDIFADIMRFWDTFPLYDAWFPDVYALYVRKLRRSHWMLAVPQYVRQQVKMLMATAEEAREVFLQESRLLVFCPDAILPAGTKAWYSFLTHQLLVEHFRYLREKLGREPYMHELTGDWYEHHFLPAYELYRRQKIRQPFQRFYMDWMTWWCGQSHKHSQVLTLPPGFILPAAITILETFTTTEEIYFPNGNVYSPGTVVDSGTVLPPGTILPQGIRLPKRVKLSLKNLFPIRHVYPDELTLQESFECYLQWQKGK